MGGCSGIFFWRPPKVGHPQLGQTGREIEGQHGQSGVGRRFSRGWLYVARDDGRCDAKTVTLII